MELSKEFIITWLKSYLKDIEANQGWHLVSSLNRVLARAGNQKKFIKEIELLERETGVIINTTYPWSPRTDREELLKNAKKLLSIFEAQGE